MRKEGYEEEVAKFFLGKRSFHRFDFFDPMLMHWDVLQKNESREIWENRHETFAPVLHKIKSQQFIPRQTQRRAIILVGPPMSGKST